MIVKVKANENDLPEIESLLIERKKYNVYEVTPEKLNYVLDYIRKAGITKVKLDITEFYKLDKPYIKLEGKPTLMEYLEYLFYDELDDLEVTQNLAIFFLKTEFVDIDCSFLRLYNEIIRLSEEELNGYLNEYKGNKNGIYYYITSKMFDNVEEGVKFRRNLKKSIQEYLDENAWIHTKDGTGYKDFFPNGIPYTAFIRFLLKHTGHKYY